MQVAADQIGMGIDKITAALRAGLPVTAAGIPPEAFPNCAKPLLVGITPSVIANALRTALTRVLNAAHFQAP